MKLFYSITLSFCCVLVSICISPYTTSAQFSTLTNETRVNTTTAGEQWGFWWSVRTLAVQPDGGYIIVWIDNGSLDGSAKGIFGQRFNSSGAKVGSEFQVNTTTNGDQFSPSIAVAPNGSFIVTWEGPGTSIDSWAQMFTKDGVKIGTEFLLNTTVTGSQRYPEIQFYPDGTFVAGFVDAAQTVLQRYNADGRPIGIETRITSGTGDVVMDALCVRPDNSLVLVWTSGNDVYGQIFSSTLAPIGSQTRLNTFTTGTQEYAVARVDGDGNFVVVWEDNTSDGSGMGVYYRKYDKNFNPLSATELAVTANKTGDQFEPQVAIAPNGRFIIAWSDNNNRDGGGGSPSLAGPGASLWMREFDANGNPVGAETMINQSISGYQAYPVIEMNASGGFVVAWEGNGTQAGQIDDYGVYARAYQLSQTGTSSVSVSPTTTTAADIVTITMTLTNPSSIANVKPNPLSVSGTNEVFATLISGPSPASATVGTSPVTFTWTYRVTANESTGQLTFGGNASNNTGNIFPYAVSNTISIKPSIFLNDITGPNLINDANSNLGPRVFTIGAKITNPGLTTLTNVNIYIGNGVTPGTFPVSMMSLYQTNNTYQGSFALSSLGGSGDCTRSLNSLAPAKTVIAGSIDFNADGIINSSDDGVLGNGKTVIDGRIDVNLSGSITTTDDKPIPPGLFNGYREPAIIDGYVDTNRDGIINAADAGTYGGETKNIYWQVKYDVVDAYGQSTFGNCNDFVDDLRYDWVIWASGTDAGVTRTDVVNDFAKVRCMLSAAANKLSPSGGYLTGTPPRLIDGMVDINGDGKITNADDGIYNGKTVIDGKLDMNNSGTITTADDGVFNTYTVMDGYTDLDRNLIINSSDNGIVVQLLQNFSITVKNADFGTVGNGFDENRDGLWDYDLWYQPVGSTSWSSASYRLVDIQADIRGTGGNNPLNGITTHYDNEPYLSRLFDDRLGQSGGFTADYTYTFTMLQSVDVCFSPYQQAASGTNNEKYNADYNSCMLKIYTASFYLPVELINFRAEKQEENSHLTWETSQEINNHHFDIEFSRNGIDFEKIGEVAGAGNSNTFRQYSFLHRDPVNGINYYRLKCVDIDGKTKYSEVRSVTYNGITSVSVFPNPTTNIVFINSGGNNMIQSVMVYTADGKQVQRYSNFHSGNSINLGGYPDGFYFIKMIEADGKVTVKKITKN